MIASPWDGGDRRALVAAIAAVAAWDLVGVALELLVQDPSGSPHPDAPQWLLALGRTPAVVVVVAFVGIAGLGLGMRARTRLLGLVVALASSTVLGEALAASSEGPWRARFFVGAALLGAIVGEAWAKWAGARETTRGRALEAGALGMLAATWFGAGLSKLGGAGLAWADATTLRAIAVAHAHVDAPGLAATVAGSATAARALAITTLVVQLAAPALLLGARVRLVVALAIIGFHVGVAVVTRIGYWQPVALLLAFALPWPRWIAGVRIAASEEPPPEHERRATLRVLAIAVVIVAIAWWPGVRAYTAGHHRARDGASVVARRSVERFGPLAVGDALVAGWRIAALELEDARTVVVITHADHGRVVLWVSKRTESRARSPFDGETVAVAYAHAAAPVDAFAPAALECARRLDAAPPW